MQHHALACFAQLGTWEQLCMFAGSFAKTRRMRSCQKRWDFVCAITGCESTIVGSHREQYLAGCAQGERNLETSDIDLSRPSPLLRTYLEVSGL